MSPHSKRHSQYYTSSDPALATTWDNAEIRAQLEKINKQFLILLRNELLEQYMRHRFSDAD